ncbi:hypothetical protein SAMN05216304_101635 [Bosea sp. OK403]|uniref:hypothetical protein n=1 Tax=Bosea sp. OK403 TaxID=1855286 RepID=UPI0008F18B6D|nr:hypothetical protein [Bosea sp. OK403]SFI05628.1 hypothetical protein SAMN05216304_101635 [Bosea sp. OK403]
MKQGGLVFAGAVAALTFCTMSPAYADAIDGAWCSENGRRFTIEGSAVTTTKGLRLSGNYTRHTFNFTLPPEEADAGSPVDMVLQGETQVRVTIGSAAAQTWRRCTPGIS